MESEIENKRIITDLKEKLRELEDDLASTKHRVERLQLLFDNSNDSIFVYRPKPDKSPGRFIQVNDVATQSS